MPRYARSTFAPLCASCRSFVLSRLPHPPPAPALAALPRRPPRLLRSITTSTPQSQTPPSQGASPPSQGASPPSEGASPPSQGASPAPHNDASPEPTNGQFPDDGDVDYSNSLRSSSLHSALVDYLGLVEKTSPRSPGRSTLKKHYVERKATTEIFVGGNPDNELVTGPLLPLSEAIKSRDLKEAWKQYIALSRSPTFENPLVKKMLRQDMTSQLFDLILEQGPNLPELPPAIQVANEWVEKNIANPSFFSKLIVHSLKGGAFYQVESILKYACRICPPYRLELAYLRGQIMDLYEDQNNLSASTIDEPQIVLWVLIYCAYLYMRFKNNADVHTAKVWPIVGTFFADLHHAIPQMRLLPSELKIREILSSHGFSQEFIDTVVKSAGSLETTNFFTHLRGLREEIKSAVRRRDVPHLQTLYEEGIRTVPPFKGHHYNLFILAFASLNHIDSATHVWNDMLKAGIEPTVHSWNALLMGCGKARDARFLGTLWMKMTSSGVKPDTFLWTTRTHALLNSGHVKEGLQSLRQMAQQTDTRPSLLTINAVIDGLMKNNCVKEAQGILDWAVGSLGISPDLVTYNTLLRGHMAAGDIVEGMRYLAEMESHGMKPDVVTCTIILNGLYRHSLRHGIVPTSAVSFLQNTVTSQPEDGSTPWSSADDPPNSEENSTTTPPTAKTPQEALFQISTELLQQMQQSGITANATFYTVLIDGLLHPSSANIVAARDILSIMQWRGIEGTSATYTVFIRYYFTMGDIDGVEACWRDLVMRGVPPDRIILEETIKCYARMRPPPELFYMPPQGTNLRTREWHLSFWRDRVVQRIMYWLRKIDELNLGHPLTLQLLDNPPPLVFPETGMYGAFRRMTGTSRGVGAMRDVVTVDEDKIGATTGAFRISMRTYKEVIMRLMAEQKLNLVEIVLRDLARRVKAEEEGSRPGGVLGIAGYGGGKAESLEQLEGVLKVAAARGVVVPRELVFVPQGGE
ncbi:hypothetical protein BDZ91DRAFT_318185 [Kalaharituber pfeilii]|nr:hypothetical protein BDZ91DRAFT_318185 [Kalaharituber pfeilii]